MCYYQSPVNWKHITILGIGAGKVSYRQLKKFEHEFPGFTCEFIESSPPHTQLYSSEFSVVKKTFDPKNPRLLWQDMQPVSTSELVLCAEETNKEDGQKAIYVATVAHSVTGQEAPGQVFTNQSQLRGTVESTSTLTRFALRSLSAKPSTFDLKGPPLLSHRLHYDMTAETKSSTDHNSNRRSYECAEKKCTFHVPEDCIHRYMNDIAILQISTRASKSLQRTQTSEANLFESLKFDGIHAVNFLELQQMVEVGKTTAYIRDINCRLLPSFVGGNNPKVTRGFCVHFAVESESLQLEPGHSGSILYVKTKDGKKYALAMFVGALPGNLSSPVYEAIFLDQAIKDIEKDYPHHVRHLGLLPSTSF